MKCWILSYVTRTRHVHRNTLRSILPPGLACTRPPAKSAQASGPQHQQRRPLALRHLEDDLPGIALLADGAHSEPRVLQTGGGGQGGEQGAGGSLHLLLEGRELTACDVKGGTTGRGGQDVSLRTREGQMDGEERGGEGNGEGRSSGEDKGLIKQEHRKGKVSNTSQYTQVEKISLKLVYSSMH